MSSLYKKFLYLVIFSFLLSFPGLIYAQSAVKDGLNEVQNGNFSNTRINADNIPQLIGDVIGILLGIAGAIAVLFVLFGGFQYMTAGGSDDQTKKAKATILNALIGIVLIVLSYAIVNVVVDLVTSA